MICLKNTIVLKRLRNTYKYVLHNQKDGFWESVITFDNKCETNRSKINRGKLQ